MDCKDLWKTYRYPISGGLVGLVMAVLFITIGFWKTLLIFSFVALGAGLASYLKKWINN